MKFEQALRAMRQGEKVRRKCWTGPARYRIVKGQIVISPTGNRADPHHDEVLADDWVIVRKKPKAPAPRYTEDQLEPVGTEARVGDIIVAMEDKAYDIGPARRGDLFDYVGNGLINSRRSFGSTMRSNGWFFSKDEPSLRILRRPAKPLRNVFADPRVGDVIELKTGADRYTVVAVDDDRVTFACGDVGVQSREVWAAPRNAYTVISRAPEVAQTA